MLGGAFSVNFPSTEFFPFAASVAQSQPPISLRCSCFLCGFFQVWEQHYAHGQQINRSKNKAQRLSPRGFVCSGASLARAHLRERRSKQVETWGGFSFFMPRCISGLTGTLYFPCLMWLHTCRGLEATWKRRGRAGACSEKWVAVVNICCTITHKCLVECVTLLYNFV